MPTVLSDAEEACLASIAGAKLAWSRESVLLRAGVELATLASLETAGWLERWPGLKRGCAWTFTPWGAWSWQRVIRENHGVAYIAAEDPTSRRRKARVPMEVWRPRWVQSRDDPSEGRVAAGPWPPDRVFKHPHDSTLPDDLEPECPAPSPIEELVMVETIQQHGEDRAEVVSMPLRLLGAMVKLARGSGWGRRPAC